jgi:hypothetical protein
MNINLLKIHNYTTDLGLDLIEFLYLYKEYFRLDIKYKFTEENIQSMINKGLLIYTPLNSFESEEVQLILSNEAISSIHRILLIQKQEEDSTKDSFEAF